MKTTLRTFRPYLGATITALLIIASSEAATITVTTNADDTTPNDGSVCLREAITAINAGNALGDPNITAQNPGTFGTDDRINFNIPRSGVQTIAVASGGLPPITKPVTIDGYTQPGASANTLAVGDNAVLLIELNGASATSSGLTLGGTNGGSSIRGLVINRFVGQFTDAGINIISGNNVVVGCFIGVDPAGNTKLANGGGIRIVTGANNLIGRATPADRNIISGNNASTSSSGDTANVAVAFNGGYPPSVPLATGTVIRNNYLGTNAAGTAAISDPSVFGATDGVFLAGGTGTIVGGADAEDGAADGTIGARNVISGNAVGISTRFGFYDGDVTVEGNFIGVNAAGTGVLGNYNEGINFAPYAQDGSRFTVNSITVGGTAVGSGNVVSGQVYGAGLYLATRSALVQGNRIGTDLSGTLNLGNGGSGLELTIAGYNYPDAQATVGGTTSAARNIISGNGSYGVRVSGKMTAAVQGNYIGTLGDGVSPLGNRFNGIAALTTVAIGGTTAGAGNVIAFNYTGAAAFDMPRAGILVGDIDNIPTGVSILGNSTFGNGGLGISLGGEGPVVNDLGDADSGANNLQNYPILTSARAIDNGVSVIGTLNSIPNTTYRIEFFGNTGLNPFGFGEGRTYLGFTNVTTDGSGNASFDAPVASGSLITSTATDPNGNTSEYSQSTGQLLNISTRLRVQTGENVLIGGFIVTGTDPKKVMVRAIGPSLNFANALHDPMLELHDGSGATIAANDNWKIDYQTGQSQQAEIEATTIAPKNDLESALVKTIPANGAAYTAIVRGNIDPIHGQNDPTGTALVEAYDLDPAATSRLANISTRGLVETGDNVLIGGIIIGPGSGHVIVRAIGPSLVHVGVTGVLKDPTLEVRDRSGSLVGSNDNWKINDQTGQSQEADIRATTIPPSDDAESAIVATVSPGAYTAVVRGKNDSTGIALVEAYSLP